MKQITLLLSILFAALLATAAPTSGNDHGNGGGVICIKGKCQTLIDSGLTVSAEYPDFWIPDEAVLKTIKDLINRYPFMETIRTKIYKQVLLKLTHFKVVEIVDPVKVDAIKNIYVDAIKATSPTFDFSNFKIVAMSSDNSALEQNTFLLPDFFNLDTLSQANILIHEGFYRGRVSTDLKYILQLETALKIFETYPNSAQESDIRKQMISAQISAYHLKILTPEEIFLHMIISTYGTAASKYLGFNESSFQDNYGLFKFSNVDNKKSILNIDKDFVLKNAYIDGRTTVMLLNLAENISLNKISELGGSCSDYTHRFDLVSKKIFACESTAKETYIYKKYEYTFTEPEKLDLLLPK